MATLAGVAARYISRMIGDWSALGLSSCHLVGIESSMQGSPYARPATTEFCLGAVCACACGIDMLKVEDLLEASPPILPALPPNKTGSSSPGASSLSINPGWPSGSRWAPKPLTLNMLVRPPLVAVWSCSLRRASWYCRFIEI